jgi:hypothetical protein
VTIFKKKRNLCACLFLALAGLFASCSSSNPYARLDDAVMNDEFAQGLTVIDGSFAEGGEPIYDAEADETGGFTGGDVISLLLDKGLVAHYAALKGQAVPDKGPVDFKTSAESLKDAETKIEEAAAGSKAQSLLTFIVNDKSKDYAGEVYEDIYLTIFNALNYYQQGDLDNCIALARSVSEKITAYSDAAGKSLDVPADSGDGAGEEDGALAAAIGQVMDSVKSGFNAILANAYKALGAGEKPVEFSNSALANYLAALAYRAKGDAGSSRVSFDNLNKAYKDAPEIYKNSPPASLAEELTVPGGKARLNVLAFAGVSPVKQEVEVPAPLPAALFPLVGAKGPVTLLVPALVERTIPPENIKISVSVENGPSFELELLEDMVAVTKGVFRAKLPGLLFKTYLRVTAKCIAVEAAAKKSGNALAQTAAIAGGMAAINATEGADTRMGRYFPAYAYAGGVTLDPGTYTLTVKYSNGYSFKKENVEVKAGGLNLVEAVSVNRK